MFLDLVWDAATCLLAYGWVFGTGVLVGALLTLLSIGYYMLYASSKAIVFADGVSHTSLDPSARFLTLTPPSPPPPRGLSPEESECLGAAGVAVVDAASCNVADLDSLVVELHALEAYLSVLRSRHALTLAGHGNLVGNKGIRGKAAVAAAGFHAGEHREEARVDKTDVILHEGVVDMIGGRWHMWKHRFAVVLDGLLRVYNKKGTELRYEVPLAGAVLKEDANRDPETNHSFILARPPDDNADEPRVEYFRCPDDAERTAWISALSAAISRTSARHVEILPVGGSGKDEAASSSSGGAVDGRGEETSSSSASSAATGAAGADDFPADSQEYAPQWESAEWMNALFPLFYHELRITGRIARYEEYMRARFAARLNSIEKPNFVQKLIVSNLELGRDPPVVEAIKSYPFDSERDEQTVRAYVYLPSSTTMTISTVLFGAIPVVVTVDVTQVTGEIELVIPGSLNRLATVMFVRPPSLGVRIVSRIGKEGRVKNIPLLAEFLTSRIHAEVRRQFVAPHKRYFSIPFNGRAFAIYSDDQMIQIARGLPLERDEYFYDEDAMAEFVGAPKSGAGPLHRTISTASSSSNASMVVPGSSEGLGTTGDSDRLGGGGGGGGGALIPSIHAFKAHNVSVAFADAGVGAGATRGWNAMYVVLSGATVAFYQSRSEPEPERVVELQSTTYVEYVSDVDAPADTFPLRVDTDGEPVFDLAAESATERTEWIRAFKAAGAGIDGEWIRLASEARERAAVAVQAWTRGMVARRRVAAVAERKELLDIMIESERAYVGELAMLIDGYRCPLIASLKSEDPILFSMDAIDAVTGPFSVELHALHGRLLADLTQRADGWTTYTTIGDAFLTYTELAGTILRRVGTRIPNSLSRLKRAAARNPGFASFLCAAEGDGLLDLRSLLAKPQYRADKYIILLQNIRASTSRLLRHHDLPLLDKSIRALEVIATSIKGAVAKASLSSEHSEYSSL